jgi:DNA-binding CsgD family transcriptional regulator
MGNRQESLDVGEIRRILKLVNQLHTMPPGGDGRRRTLLDGLCDLVGADAGESALVEVKGDALRVQSSVRGCSERRRGLIVRRLGGRELADPAVERLIGMLGCRGTLRMVTHTRRDLLADRAWYQSRFTEEVRQRAGFDDAVYSARVLTPGLVAVLCLARQRCARRPMGSRECRITHLFHSEGGWVYDTSTAIGPAGLTPRQRECLACLLVGKSEKQIASDMKLSPHTVHVHVKAVYRELEVSTRAELMAQFMAKAARSASVGAPG